MRHARGYRRLNRTHEHRKAMFANMCGALIESLRLSIQFPAQAGIFCKVGNTAHPT